MNENGGTVKVFCPHPRACFECVDGGPAVPFASRYATGAWFNCGFVSPVAAVCFAERTHCEAYCEAYNLGANGWDACITVESTLDWVLDTETSSLRRVAWLLKSVPSGVECREIVSDYYVVPPDWFQPPPWDYPEGEKLRYIPERRPRVVAGSAERKPESVLYTVCWGDRPALLLRESGVGGVVIRGALNLGPGKFNFHGSRLYRTREGAQAFVDRFVAAYPSCVPPSGVFGVEADWDADAYDALTASQLTVPGDPEHRFLRHDACLVPV